MNILLIGDIVGKPGRNLLADQIDVLKKQHRIDFTVVNGENSAGGSGITPRIANHLFRMGVDVITLGDHVWDRQEELIPYLEDHEGIIRPANFPEGAPGKGWYIKTTSSGVKIASINLLGRVFMRYNVDCPFRSLERILEQVRKETNIILVDFHAEATSEKIAMGFFSDGRVSAVVGTHTHVQTADEQVLPKGTAYITDLGMTGPHDSIIGQDKEAILKRFWTGIPVRFEVAKQDPRIKGVVVEVDDRTGLARRIERIHQKPNGDSS